MVRKEAESLEIVQSSSSFLASLPLKTTESGLWIPGAMQEQSFSATASICLLAPICQNCHPGRGLPSGLGQAKEKGEAVHCCSPPTQHRCAPLLHSTHRGKQSRPNPHPGSEYGKPEGMATPEGGSGENTPRNRGRQKFCSSQESNINQCS